MLISPIIIIVSLQRVNWNGYLRINMNFTYFLFKIEPAQSECALLLLGPYN